MPTTSNFGWTTPADTDLVKDGAAAIRTLGNGIDTSLVDLKGGTTGQVLSKASDTDLDFSWVAQDDSNAIQNALLTTTGDTIYASSASTPARLGIGTTGQILTVSGGVPVWATPAGSNENWSLVNSGGTSLSGAATVTVSGITGANRLMVLINQASSANASAYIFIQINSDTGSNYNSYGINNTAASAYAASNFTKQNETTTGIRLFRMPNDATASGSAYCLINGGNSAGVKAYLSGGGAGGGGNNAESIIVGGWYTGTSTISSISVFSNSGNLDGGTVWVYKTA